jgi:UDP-GlcNAc3NAcA epimerase
MANCSDSEIRICNIAGARPQFIKMSAILRACLKDNCIDNIIIHTGQHYDSNMSDVFFKKLDIPKPDYNLGIGSNSHGKQTGQMLDKIEKILLNIKPDFVIVYGDTNSTIAGALASTKINIDTVHIEAGLRSYNRQMPEEINRVATDHISDILFAPTINALHTLISEQLEEKSYFSGDVMYDSILYYYQQIRQKCFDSMLNNINKPYYLTTIHRPVNVDNINNLKSIIKALATFEYPVVFPIHPRTQKNINLISIPDNLKIIEPVDYLTMLMLISNAEIVFTDSGGIQKECFFLKKRCVTLRNETEWIETLNNNWNILTGADTQKIIRAAESTTGKYNILNKFGDGKASEYIINKLKRIRDING